ncbi:hypothetical protein AB0E01_22970 [Nocardia vinacea]|uniref:hypothetical protein n=1 Tax=Nocardia vinacea TaxID=96468 RepID=UPI0033D61CCB
MADIAVGDWVEFKTPFRSGQGMVLSADSAREVYEVTADASIAEWVAGAGELVDVCADDEIVRVDREG